MSESGAHAEVFSPDFLERESARVGALLAAYVGRAGSPPPR